MIEVRAARPDDADAMHAVMLAAFAAHGHLDPPSGALRETVDVLHAAIGEARAVVATADGEVVGGLRIEVHDGVPHVRRVSVRPDRQGRGICRALMRHVEEWSRAQGHPQIALGVRVQLPENRALYEHLGYSVIAEHDHPETGRPLWLQLTKELG